MECAKASRKLAPSGDCEAITVEWGPPVAFPAETRSPFAGSQEPPAKHRAKTSDKAISEDESGAAFVF
jgi:hypothetical protein